MLLIIKSADVLHSFFLPNLRMKQDVVPGMEQYMWFKATRDGQLRHRLCRAVRLGPLQDERPRHVRAAQRVRRLAQDEMATNNKPARSPWPTTEEVMTTAIRPLSRRPAEHTDN